MQVRGVLSNWRAVGVCCWVQHITVPMVLQGESFQVPAGCAFNAQVMLCWYQQSHSNIQNQNQLPVAP